MLDLSIAAGLVPIIALVLGIGCFVFLLSGRGRVWWGRVVPIVIGGSILVTAALALYSNYIWHPFADAVPTTALIWIALTLAALGLAVFRPRKWPVRTGAAGLAVVIAVCGAIQMNAELGTYPNLRSVLALDEPNQVAAAQILKSPTATTTATADAQTPSESGSGSGSAETDPPATSSVPSPPASTTPAPAPPATTAPPVPMPTSGQVTSIAIPGTVSGFAARDAWIYLPPAYQPSTGPALPVLILLAGQPGEPRNWFDGGQVAQTMDAYAAAHLGVAPVVVVPDWLGGETANPLCVDSASGGQDFSYLTVDVRNWVLANLQVSADPAKWAVGGLSAGATCAAQIGTNRPDLFPTFLAFSTQEEPTLGDHQSTLDTYFGGNEAAFTAIDPKSIMAAKQFPGSGAMFVAGASDQDYGPQTRTLYKAAKAAGMDAQYLELPGGHDFPLWAAALSASMPWLGGRLGIAG